MISWHHKNLLKIYMCHLETFRRSSWFTRGWPLHRNTSVWNDDVCHKLWLKSILKISATNEDFFANRTLIIPFGTSIWKFLEFLTIEKRCAEWCFLIGHLWIHEIEHLLERFVYFWINTIWSNLLFEV